jgi:hypothetical protein
MVVFYVLIPTFFHGLKNLSMREHKGKKEKVIPLQAAFQYFRQAHQQYLWLHVIVAIVLMITSVFWFVLPYYIVSYGLFETVMEQFVFFIVLFLWPSLLITLHCWFINFQAAVNWKKNHPNESVWRWMIKFQSITIVIVIVFTAFIITGLFFIDAIR